MSAQPFQLANIRMAWARVRHKRTAPKLNAFDTKSCFVSLDFYRDEPKKKLPAWPAIDKPGLISIQAKNYGFGDTPGASLTELVEQVHHKVAHHTGLSLHGKVTLQTFPRILGFVFNPVSFWFFHESDGACGAVLCEVNNTFGERHFYLLDNAGGEVTKGMDLFANKEFHVSPFFPVSGHYRFRFARNEEHSLARIDYFEGDVLQLSTSVSGSLKEATRTRWLLTLSTLGWFTVSVVWKIHWQAIKLWIKGATFHTKPSAPNQQLTQAKVEL